MRTIMVRTDCGRGIWHARGDRGPPTEQGCGVEQHKGEIEWEEWLRAASARL